MSSATVSVKNLCKYDMPMRLLRDRDADEPPMSIVYKAESITRNVPIGMLVRALRLQVWRLYFGANGQPQQKLEILGYPSVDAFLDKHAPKGAPGRPGSMAEPLAWSNRSKVAELRACLDARGIDPNAFQGRDELLAALDAHDRGERIEDAVPRVAGQNLRIGAEQSKGRSSSSSASAEASA